MGTSLAAGLDQMLTAKPHLQAVLILVCDQPLIDRDYLARLIETARSSASGIVATDHQGNAGVPALFKQKYFAGLLRSAGKQGARKMIREHAADCAILQAGSKAMDVDTPEDYRRAQAADE